MPKTKQEVTIEVPSIKFLIVSCITSGFSYFGLAFTSTM
jgi:hypothetical protein